MSKSWSGLRKELEHDLISDGLRGRIQYFLTHYNGAPDNFGRIAVRVDGKEVVKGNPYTFYINYQRMELQFKSELNTPRRVWNGKEIIYDNENKVVEDKVKEIAINNGVFEIYDITDAIRIYKNSPIKESIVSVNPIVRMFTVMDRRIGKRTLLKLKKEIDKQPEWLQFFYKLRIESENI